jgi:hypothetical protein
VNLIAAGRRCSQRSSSAHLRAAALLLRLLVLVAWRAALLDFWLLLFGIVPHLPCSFGRACLIERLSDGLADVVLGTLEDALRVAFGEAVEERRFPFDVSSSALRPCDERFEREALVDPIELAALAGG